MKKILIISPPRSGSSVLSQLLETAGFSYPASPSPVVSKVSISPSEFNPSGYNEDTLFTLLNDQLIRILYGNQYSFLHSPSIADIEKSFAEDLKPYKFKSFCYDLDEKSVIIPDSYPSRLHELANHSWDVWGLTRMGPLGKWYQAYSKHNVSNGEDIYDTYCKYLSFLSNDSSSTHFYLKDPRLIFAAPAYVPTLKKSGFSIIIINRSTTDLLSSMRGHYGNRLFTDNCIDNLGFVSNHFNYRIKPQEFSDYIDSVEFSINMLKASGIPFLSISYDNLMDHKTRSFELVSLNNFIGAEVDPSILRDPN
ncbi:hypothetical protein N9U74_01090 [Synechococcus sp. AH-736-M02]|nr:hypothetical protein [Synechococcus sp. AH-736-M02]